MPEVLRDAVSFRRPSLVKSSMIPRAAITAPPWPAFGICANPDRLRSHGRSAHPHSWSDLGEPRLFGAVAMADPTKSGSIATCYVMMLQEQLAIAVRDGWCTRTTATPCMLDAAGTWLHAHQASGWQCALCDRLSLTRPT